MNAPCTLLVFVDGLGLGLDDPGVNPIHSGVCPVLEQLLLEAVPVDAAMGVPGLPQSATGQTALLTGTNAPAIVGRHVEGLPGPSLREVIREKNIFGRLAARGFRSTFANGYFTDDIEEVRTRRRQSVTTVAALAGLGTVRDSAALLKNDAVYQDLTREFLRGRGYDGPLVAPEDSGRHLLDIAARHDFTLFEFFLTDLAAHKGNPAEVKKVLARLDAFLGVVLAHAERPRGLFVLTSDHGNVEDLSTRQHTTNPVPLVARGEGAAALREKVKSLADFVPALLELYGRAE